ncbi:pantoate--beta-alanine ligase [Nitrincola sp. MINF-07-Sa-05]|uniref:pantoate--beta-alanine ligase n=1 Tax=Nitrincola salilacus TaxID=3400273 RepID=UPI00391852BE
MQTLHTIAELRSALSAHRKSGKKIALVPTMGNLHRGHIKLVEIAATEADIVVASIFVNPLQFGPNEDLDSYPRTLLEDQSKLQAAGCDYLFAPNNNEIYPEGRDQQTLVEVPMLSDLYCGTTRPGHFCGVTTVVCKLFNICQPDLAIFGEKDYQQLRIIRKMVSDLCIPVEIRSVATVRAEDGLALSSRNGYLSDDERAVAPALQHTLRQTCLAINQGNHDFRDLEAQAENQLSAAGLTPDYVRIVRRSDLLPAQRGDKSLVILTAAYLGVTRLIDNCEIDCNS